jgi:hypothetical protein
MLESIGEKVEATARENIRLEPPPHDAEEKDASEKFHPDYRENSSRF